MARGEKPHNIEAENIVLGAMLASEDARILLFKMLRREDFYDEANGIIFQAMVNISNNNREVNRLNLTEELRKSDNLEGIGGASYIAKLISETPSTVNAEEYAKVVLDKSALRHLILTSEKILHESYEEKKDVENILNFAEEEMLGILQRNKADKDYIFLEEVFKKNIEEIELLKSGDYSKKNFNTGFKDLDKILNGISSTDLVVIAARPGVGKTSFALTLAKKLSDNYNKKTLIFNLEMTDEQLGKKFLSMGAKVPLENIISGDLDDSHMASILEYKESNLSSNIAIDHETNPTMMDIKSQCRKMQAKHGLDMIILDYIQIMDSGSGKNSDNRNQEIAELTRSFKLLAREMGCPVILLSQLSRSIETRGGTHKKPRLSDLKDSGAIEQDADIVMFLSKEDIDSLDDSVEMEAKRKVCDLVLAKNRNGSIGNVQLAWVGKFTTFEDAARMQGVE